MPMPVGTWTIFTLRPPGAQQGALTIFTPGSNPAGSLTIGGVAAQPLRVLWDEGSQHLTFTTATAPVAGPVPSFEVFQGWAFQPYPTTLPPIMLAGTFQGYSPVGPAAPLSPFGWYAIAAPKPKEKDKEKEKEKEKEHKDKEQPEAKAPELQFGSGAAESTLQMLEQRLATIEQQLATGKPFISSEERPPVGERALGPHDKGETTG